MAIVRAICTDALMEIGAIGQGDTMGANDGALALLRFQNQMDAWAADRLTLSLLTRQLYTIPSGDSFATIGPSGADITAQRPMFVNQVNYIIPGTNPGVETLMAAMNEDQYAAVSIKSLSSSLPQEYFYQTLQDSILGQFFFWPQVSQNVEIAIYFPQAVTVPASLDTVVRGPSGYQEAFMYQLALRLCTPFGRPVPALLPEMAARAYRTMTRPNVSPGLLGIDPAVVPVTSGGYNVLSDNSSSPGGGR